MQDAVYQQAQGTGRECPTTWRSTAGECADSGDTEMTEREQFEAWFAKQDALTTPECGYESLEGDLAFLAWMICAEQKDKEIEFLKECVTVSNNDTKYYRDRLEEAEKEIESLHDRLAGVIGQREAMK